jgi:NAD(P) transhydrogenase subunit alpha
MVRRVIFGLSVTLIVCAALGLAAAREVPSKASDLAVASNTTVSEVAGSEAAATTQAVPDEREPAGQPTVKHAQPSTDTWSTLFVFVLATFIGLGVVIRVSRLLHTPLMSITNAISAIAVVGSIIVTGSDYPRNIRILGAIALFASMTNIVSGFLITDRMLKMFKSPREEVKR